MHSLRILIPLPPFVIPNLTFESVLRTTQRQTGFVEIRLPNVDRVPNIDKWVSHLELSIPGGAPAEGITYLTFFFHETDEWGILCNILQKKISGQLKSGHQRSNGQLPRLANYVTRHSHCQFLNHKKQSRIGWDMAKNIFLCNLNVCPFCFHHISAKS